MNRLSAAAVVLLLLACSASAQAAIVINEIFYHAPNDLDDLQWIELYNPGQTPVDLAGWKLKKGVSFTFPEKTSIAPNGFLVLCSNPDRFGQFYKVQALGGMAGALGHGKGKIELCNAKDEVVDAVQYKDDAPFPASADGESASLERISPLESGQIAHNWAPSLLTPDGSRPAGSPGERNAAYSANLPPAIHSVTCTPEAATPTQPLLIEADIQDPDGLGEVCLLYRVVAMGFQGPESLVMMKPDPATKRYTASIPPQKPNLIVRFRIRATDTKGNQRTCPSDSDLRPAFSALVYEKYELGKVPLGFIMRLGPDVVYRPEVAQAEAGRAVGSFLGGLFGSSRPRSSPSANNRPQPPQGPYAFIYVDPKTGTPTLFDFVNVSTRYSRNGSSASGYKVRLHKDRLLNGISTVNFVYEGNDRFLLAEALAYDLYRRAGSPACLSDFARLYVDGRFVGHHLLIEQPNSAFLRRNKVKSGGNLYKILWYGGDIVGKHEKKTNTLTGHEDVVDLVNQLQRTSGPEQWQVIQKNFNIPQVANYFAVNMILSHWDGFFNNYFTYHDTQGTRKWEIYPWDQDKTWGYHDGIWGDEPFTDMPLSFGMNGDRAPGGGFFGGGGTVWWRPPGYFSGPLLAHPEFRKVYLQRIKDLLDKSYTEAVYFPLIDDLAARLEPEIRLRAQLMNGDPTRAAEQFARQVRSLKDHLSKRRQFLLEQPELKALANAPAANAGQ